jgi:hypothetical protein
MLMVGQQQDPFLGSVVFLMGADGTNGSTTVPDESPAAHGNASISGAAAISTAQFVFGGSSLSIPSASNKATWLHSNDWTLGPTNTTPFTLECWIRPASLSGFRCIIGRYSGLGGRGFEFATTGTELVWQWAANLSTSNQTLTTSGAGFAINTWYAVAVDKDSSGKIRLYVDGVMKASSTPADSTMTNDPATNLTVGASSISDNYTGFIEEIRITKGIARYASDGGYTVTASRFPRT